MTEPGTASSRYWSGGLCLGLFAALLLGSAGMLEAQTARPSDPAVAGTSAAPQTASLAVEAPALSTEPAAASSAQPSSLADLPPADRERRMLMLLLMHSSGPLGPYGSLGR